jgi:hypothetical protein
MLHLTEGCLDRWVADYEAFREEFLRYCYFVAKGCGYYPEVNFPRLKTAHEGWHAECHVWQTTYITRDSDRLSHIKMMAILLDKLASAEWVTELYEFDPSGDRREGEYRGTADQLAETRADIKAGRGTFLAYQFVIGILNSFEQSRDDAIQLFAFRMTTSLEHDFMAYLLSERRNAMAIYLILEALYARDPKPKTA